MVSKNLSLLRKRANLTQDDLAEKLHVTRQAVSNWETGKCQPDVETLTALSEALHCDVTELIYGAKPTPYCRFSKKYIVWTAVLGAVVLAFIGCEIWLVPYLNEQVQASFDLLPKMHYLILVRPVGSAAAGALVIAALSLWAELRLPRGVRIVLLTFGILCFVLWLFHFLFLLFSIYAESTPAWWPSVYPLFRFFLTDSGTRLTTSVLPIFGAAALFLGSRKR